MRAQERNIVLTGTQEALGSLAPIIWSDSATVENTCMHESVEVILDARTQVREARRSMRPYIAKERCSDSET